MAEVDFITLLPEVMPECGGVNEFAVVRCVRLAVRYFCEQTDFLKAETDPLLDLVENQATYTIPADALGRTILRALEVWIDGEKLAHRSEQQLDLDAKLPREQVMWTTGHSNLTFANMTTQWRTETEYPPRLYYQESSDTLRLVGIPEQAATTAMRVVYSVQPAMTHESVDGRILDRWYELIKLGTLGHLYAMPQKSWSDPDASLAKLEAFDYGIQTALSEQIKGYADNDYQVGRVRAHP